LCFFLFLLFKELESREIKLCLYRLSKNKYLKKYLI
jgi:hypothetical protein